MEIKDIKVGDLVIGNGGYVGCITKIVDWSDTLVEVRYPGGVCCQDTVGLIPCPANYIKK